MKNKITSIIIMISIFSSLLTPYTFSASASSSDINSSKYWDIDSDDDYFDAVNLLSELNIISGYPDGSFKPDKKVTRAEMVTLIISALNETEQANSSKRATQFSDVSTNHWAIGYINQGVYDEFISGMSETIFAPDEGVTYMQAMKMLVSAIGYETYSQRDGGWPNGYRTWGNNFGIGNGVYASDNTELDRGEVAIMLYNTVIAPVCVIKEFSVTNDGQNVPVLESKNGKGKDFQNLLTKRNDVYTVEGYMSTSDDFVITSSRNFNDEYFEEGSNYKISLWDSNYNNSISGQCTAYILNDNEDYSLIYILSGNNGTKSYQSSGIGSIDFDDNSEVIGVSVSFTDNRSNGNVKIKEIEKSDLIYTATGIKGSAVDITSPERFGSSKAVISFEYNANGLGETNPSDLAIGWYNTDLDRIEILSDCKVDTSNNTVSVETTHFSEYILVDSKEWYSVWQRGQTVVREVDNNGKYSEKFNVQLVVDCSGSMDGDRISRARECTYTFINKLSDEDRFSVIKFGSSAETVIEPTIVKRAHMDRVEDKIMSMSDGGGTNFDAAFSKCLEYLDFSDKEYNNIIVFLSDGEPNEDVPNSTLNKLANHDVKIVAVALGSGTATERMKRLSDATNGQYVYAQDSSDLDMVYNAIQGSLIGVDATDTDGDGLPDAVETTGMKNQYGAIIRTDPNLYDTDGDGISDGVEMGKLIETDKLTKADKQNGITSCVYFLMVSDPVEGHQVKDYVEKGEGLELNITPTVYKSSMKANIDVQVTNTSMYTTKDIVIFMETSDCLNHSLVVTDTTGKIIEHAGWEDDAYTIKYPNVLIPRNSFNVIIPLTCENGQGCSNLHYIKVWAKSNNGKSQVRTMNLDFNNDAPLTPEEQKSSEYMKLQFALSAFNDAVDNYMNKLKELDASKVDSDEKQLKDAAMSRVRNINFNANSITKSGSTNNGLKKDEKDAITQCFYDAMFDYYMAKAMEGNKKYYQNIKASDFAAGGTGVGKTIVKDSEALIRDILSNSTIKNTYTENGYTYDVEVNVPGIYGGSYIEATFTNTKNNQKYEYKGVKDDKSGLTDAQKAMKNYVEELYDLYVKANAGAVQAAITDLADTLGGISFSSGKLNKISISSKVEKTLEKIGLGKVDKFIGECITIHNIAKDWYKLADNLQGKDVDAALSQAQKTYNNFGNYFGNVIEGNKRSESGSVMAVNYALGQVKDALENFYNQCITYKNFTN